MNTPATTKPDLPSASTIENVLVRGDLSQLTEQQRTEYFLSVCKSLGLNPMTRPFEYLTLNGKLVLYAKRDATDQLRKINSISIEIISRERVDDLIIVTARATDKTGRSDEDLGAVPFKGGASEIAANSVMKATTKAKRRVTLAFSGLGFLDESEVAGATRDSAKVISKKQADELRKLAGEVDANMPDYLEYLSDRWDLDIARVADIPVSHFDDAIGRLVKKREALQKLEAAKDQHQTAEARQAVEARQAGDTERQPDTPESVAAKAAQARKVMEQAADSFARDDAAVGELPDHDPQTGELRG